MADANAVALQNAINRFASAARFNKIAVDGVIGPATLNGARAALEHLTIVTDDSVTELVSDQANMLLLKATTSTSVLAVNAAPLAGYLNYAANLLHLPVINMPPFIQNAIATASGIATNAAGTMFPLAPGQGGIVASIGDSWKRLPTWGKLTLGVLAGLGIMWTAKKLSKGGSLHGTRVHARHRNGSSRRYLLVEA